MSNQRKILLRAYMAEQNTYEPINRTLKKARWLVGISQERLASRMGIPEIVLQKYENGALRMPTSFMLKLLIFGLDFWSESDA